MVVKIEARDPAACNSPGPDRSIRVLREALGHKTRLCERLETQRGCLVVDVARLRWELNERTGETESLRAEKVVLNRKLQELSDHQEMARCVAMLKQIQDEAQHTAELLSSTLAEERALKRRRVGAAPD